MDGADAETPISSRPPAAPALPQQAFWKTLRFRLSVWNAGVVVVTALLTLVLLRQGVQWALLREVDQVLVDDANEIALALQSTTNENFALLQDELGRKAAGHKQRGWFVKLCDANEQIVWATLDAPKLTPLPTPRDRSDPWTHDEYRVVRRRVPNAVDKIAVIRVGATLRQVHDDVARIDRWVALAAGAVLLAAPACGYWLAARAARTVSEITETASRMRPSHLDERLPIRGTGDELDQLAATINGLLDRIAEHIQRRGDFLANAALELRTPLAAIRSAVEVTLASERSPEAYRDLLVDVIEEGDVLETLVNQLLLISESESDRERQCWQPTSLDAVVAKAVDMFRGVAESRETELVVEQLDLATVHGNRVHLRQVVSNLLDNAIKYMPHGGQVRIRLEALNERRRARFSVADDGPGIEAADQPFIFDRFFRSDRARSRDEMRGAGLGLSICKSVVDSHGGSIRCESQAGHGTTMIVELPLAESNGAQRS
jgi:signal transduction histidine kinase